MPRPKKLEFSAFWKQYPLHRDRYAAEPVWNRLSDSDRRAAVAGITAYADECKRTGVAMMYGVNYLRHRRWEDELDAHTSVPAASGDIAEEW